MYIYKDWLITNVIKFSDSTKACQWADLFVGDPNISQIVINRRKYGLRNKGFALDTTCRDNLTLITPHNTKLNKLTVRRYDFSGKFAYALMIGLTNNWKLTIVIANDVYPTRIDLSKYLRWAPNEDME